MTEKQAHSYTDEQLRSKIEFNSEMIESDENQKRATRLRKENDMITRVLTKRGAFMANASRLFAPSNASFNRYADVIRRGEY